MVVGPDGHAMGMWQCHVGTRICNCHAQARGPGVLAGAGGPRHPRIPRAPAKTVPALSLTPGLAPAHGRQMGSDIPWRTESGPLFGARGARGPGSRGPEPHQQSKAKQSPLEIAAGSPALGMVALARLSTCLHTRTAHVLFRYTLAAAAERHSFGLRVCVCFP